MKSQPLDHNIRTSCKNCVFAIYKDNTQTSCVFDRIQGFGDYAVEAYDEEKEFFVIDRLCTYYRDKLWGYDSNDLEKVEKESAISFDLILNCNNIGRCDEENIINFINNIDYYTEKLNIILLHDYDKHDILKETIMNITRMLNKKFNISMCANMDRFMHDLTMKTKKSFHTLIDATYLPHWGIFNLINSYINTDLKRFSVVYCYDSHIISNFLYKVFYHNTNDTYVNCVSSIIKESKKSDMYIEI